MEERLINAIKVVFGFTDALHLKAVKFQNTVRNSFCDSFTSLAQRLPILIEQTLVAVQKSVDDSEHEALIELCKKSLNVT